VAQIQKKLTAFFATALAGNDTFSTVFYATTLSILASGVYAPLILLAIACIAFLFRGIYQEIVGTLPLNGSVYNALLNTSSKPLAALGGVIHLLTSVCTALLSATLAITYLCSLLVPNASPTTILWGTILLLFVITSLVLVGLRESSRVAATIFLFHLTILGLFIALGVWTLLQHGALAESGNAIATLALFQGKSTSIIFFFAFATSMVSFSGMESSANFVEEQRKNVYPKTLRGMTWSILLLNPLIAWLLIQLIPMHRLANVEGAVFTHAAQMIGGSVLALLISLSAFAVLTGAALAATVSAVGLMERMTHDHCLPSWLHREHGGSWPIVLGFFLLCLTFLGVTQGNILPIAGLYTLCFLGLLTLFASANLLLRHRRPELKRDYRVSPWINWAALLFTLAGLIGTLWQYPYYLIAFLAFFIPIYIIVLCVIYIHHLLLLFERWFRDIPFLGPLLTKTHERLRDQPAYIFLHKSQNIFRALSYIQQNEQTRHVVIVHCKHDEDPSQREIIQRTLPALEQAGVYSHFKISFQYLAKAFSPETVLQFAKKHHIPKQHLFIGSIHSHHVYEYKDFKGVRIIF
jgi:amino acid transporter